MPGCGTRPPFPHQYGYIGCSGATCVIYVALWVLYGLGIAGHFAAEGRQPRSISPLYLRTFRTVFASSELALVPGEPHGGILSPTTETTGFGLYLLENTKHTVDRWCGPQMDLQPTYTTKERY